jgi:hypothetical protein
VSSGYLLRGTRKLLIPRTLYPSRDRYRYCGYEPRNRSRQRRGPWGCPRPAKAVFKKGTLKWQRNCWGSNSKPITINPLESVNAPRPRGMSEPAGMRQHAGGLPSEMLSRLFSMPNNQCGIDYGSQCCSINQIVGSRRRFCVRFCFFSIQNINVASKTWFTS